MTTDFHSASAQTSGAAQTTSRDSSDALAPYDALVLMSFGGPNKPEDVVPFLRNVTAGRGIPEERLAEVGEHYYGFGGKSPINEQNIALRAALESELRRRGVDLPVLWGNRNWEPYLTDELRTAAKDGARRFLAITTSAYYSYSSYEQYQEDFARATSALAEDGLDVRVDAVPQYFDHPGFTRTQRRIVREAAEDLAGAMGAGSAAGLSENVHILYVTHSIPLPMQEDSRKYGLGYREQHLKVIEELTAELSAAGIEWPHELVYCSRSGPPQNPWLEPDVNDRLEELAAAGTEGVVVVPIGFVSDHMEVKFDLDTEARQTATEQGLTYVRAATVGTDAEFVAGLVDLAFERARQMRGETTP